MNFIGHLYVARWHSLHPAHGLGAMLPDFASMAATRLPTFTSEPVVQGVALHHKTDAVFHGSPVFVELTTLASRTLIERGVARGTARAVAHIGVEMLIDGELLAAFDVGSAYLEALEAFEPLVPSAEDDGWAALTRLTARLRLFGIPYDYRNAEAVVERLSRVLARRPRLALANEAREPTHTVLLDAQRLVRNRLESLLAHLREELRVISAAKMEEQHEAETYAQQG